ncbi:hypothetical protein HMPREF9065_01842 [Aggregatibacter sp. oral taxon 458 str. W10330]|nr:hypothetical protein HMPREF9065_01842 [Aggregatibacter sp. oral taxon 458 str. W10330]
MKSVMGMCCSLALKLRRIIPHFTVKVGVNQKLLSSRLPLGVFTSVGF